MGMNTACIVEGTAARALEATQAQSESGASKARRLSLVPNAQPARSPKEARAGRGASMRPEDAALDGDGRGVASVASADCQDAADAGYAIVAADDLVLGAIRFFTAVIVALALASVGLLVGGFLESAPERARYVQPGDSPYSIAAGIGGAPSPGRAVDDLRELNVPGSDAPAVGQRLLLPEY